MRIDLNLQVEIKFLNQEIYRRRLKSFKTRLSVYKRNSILSKESATRRLQSTNRNLRRNERHSTKRNVSLRMILRHRERLILTTSNSRILGHSSQQISGVASSHLNKGPVLTYQGCQQLPALVFNRTRQLRMWEGCRTRRTTTHDTVSSKTRIRR